MNQHFCGLRGCITDPAAPCAIPDCPRHAETEDTKMTTQARSKIKQTKTRYQELALGHIDHGHWQYLSDGAQIGPIYKTKLEALADLERFAVEYGCKEAKD